MVQGTVVQLTADTAVLESGETFGFDYAVVSVGTAYSDKFGKSGTTTLVERRQELKVCWGGKLLEPDACYGCIIIIIIIINRRSGITSHTSHGHKTGTRSMQPVRSVPLGGPVVS